VTLTFDPLTLNVCSMSRAMCLNFKLYTKFQKHRTTRGWITDDLVNIFAFFNGGDVGDTRSLCWVSYLRLGQIWNGGKPIHALLMRCSNFGCVASFRNYTAARPILRQNSKYLTPCNIGVRVAEISRSERLNSIIVAQSGSILFPISSKSFETTGPQGQF